MPHKPTVQSLINAGAGGAWNMDEDNPVVHPQLHPSSHQQSHLQLPWCSFVEASDEIRRHTCAK